METKTQSPLATAPLSERFILAWILFHPTDFAVIVAQIQEDYFYLKPYRELFAKMVKLSDRGIPPDLYAVAQEGDIDKLAEYGELMSGLPEDIFLAIHVQVNRELLDGHIKALKDAYVNRETSLAISRGESALETMSRLSTLAATGSDRIITGSELADLVYANMTDAVERMPLPFRTINEALSGGIARGELIVVAGRQGAGKSVFLQNVAIHAVEEGKRVLFCTAEMSGLSLGNRWASMISRQKVSRNEGVDLEEASRAVAEIHDWQERLVVHELVNVPHIEAVVKRMPFDLICVDYLQKLSSSRGKSEYDRVSDISRTLDNICQQYQIPMVVAAQFNRQAEGTQPSIAHIRDSGQIEADADVVISLWQKPDDQAKPQSKLYFDILKNRNGYTLHNSESTEFALWCDKPHFRLFDIDRREGLV